MKKIIYTFIIVLIFYFSFVLKVNANNSFGTSKSEIESKLNNKNGVIIEKENFACFFKQENFDIYIVIKFIQGSNGFTMSSITHNFAPMFNSNPTIIIDSSIQYDKFILGGTKDSVKKYCDEHIVKYDGSSMMYIDSDEEQGHEGNTYRYDETIFTTDIQKETLEKEEAKVKTCTKNGIGTASLLYNNSIGWYLSNTEGKTICFANPATGTNDFIIESHKDAEFENTFNCSNYNVAISNGNNGFNSTCDYYFYEIKYESNVTDKLAIDRTGGIATYYKYGDKSTKLMVYNENDSIVVGGVEGNLNISNMSEFQSAFLSTEASKSYPKYIIKLKDSSEYTFIDSMKDNEGNNLQVDEVYIESNAFGVSGTGLPEEEIISTCKQLFGNDFLEFLNDYVFKIIWIGVPILLILLTTFDFAKVVFVDDKEGIQNAFGRLWKRAIAAILIFLTPYIIILIANIIDPTQTTIQSCAKKIREMGSTSYIIK